jgi:selenocysteine lyase/cysteine desulfurase
VEDPWQLTAVRTALEAVPQHLETGTYNIIGLIGMNAAMNLFLDIGIHLIQHQKLKLATYLIQRLKIIRMQKFSLRKTRPPCRHCLIFNKRKRAYADDHCEIHLSAKNIWFLHGKACSEYHPHFYNSKKRSIDTLLQILSKA